MYQKTTYTKWVAALRKIMPVLAEMREDRELPLKLATFALDHPSETMLGDVLGGYLSERCGADNWRPNEKSISLRFGDLIVDVCLPDEVIEVVERALRYMARVSLVQSIKDANEPRKSA